MIRFKKITTIDVGNIVEITCGKNELSVISEDVKIITMRKS